ncbi:MAG: thioredoxin family protein [Anaerolineae bacterium]|jgi:small redox-active disulfide protein 2|nr:thioredoxin family protein [Anaerolineae bacterium]
MEIKILGKGCPKCQRLEELARDAATEAGVEATFTKVKDVDDIMAYGVAITPALVIDEVLKCSGRLPQKSEIITWLQGG